MFNLLKIKSETFSVRILRMHKYLLRKHGHLDAFGQVCRSGTSVGANIAEATFAQSDADFIAKLHVSLKEANETKFWLKSLFESGYLDKLEFDSIYDNCLEIIRLLVYLLKRKKQNCGWE